MRREVHLISAQTSKISTLDKLISYVSPSTGIKRIRTKAAIDAYAYGSSTGYTGRKTRYGLSNTMPVGDDTDYSLSRLCRYARSLVTYTSIGAGAVYINASNTIGTGLKMQPSILEDVAPLSKKQIEAPQVQIKQRWKLWAESIDCDFHGQFTFNQLQFLMYVSKLTSGDVLMILPLAHEDRTVNGLNLDAHGRPVGVYVYPSENSLEDQKAVYVPFIGAKSKRRNAFLCYTTKGANPFSHLLPRLSRNWTDIPRVRSLPVK